MGSEDQAGTWVRHQREKSLCVFHVDLKRSVLQSLEEVCRERLVDCLKGLDTKESFR